MPASLTPNWRALTLDQPVPVTAWLLLDSTAHDGPLHGWAANRNGFGDGWPGLVHIVRQFSPGFSAEGLHWVRAEHIRPCPA